MDKTVILHRMSELRTRQDVLSLLDCIRESEGTRYFSPLDERTFALFCNPKTNKSFYHTFSIPKKNGKCRNISAPNPVLKQVLCSLRILFQSAYDPSINAHGFIPGRSIVSNSNRHCKKNYVLNIDLKDFFSNVTRQQVWKRLLQPPFYMNSDVAAIISGLSCTEVSTVTLSAENTETTLVKEVLPQGSPASPIITNMVCDGLDKCLTGLADRFGLEYSRYADDITFSGMRKDVFTSYIFKHELNRIIASNGFIINTEKIRLQPKGTRQEVTGLLVNKKTNVSRKYVREIRQILYIWKQYGYEAAQTRFLVHYTPKRRVRKGVPDMKNVLSGKLEYLKMVKGSSDPIYIKLNQAFVQLYNRLTGSQPR